MVQGEGSCVRTVDRVRNEVMVRRCGTTEALDDRESVGVDK